MDLFVSFNRMEKLFSYNKLWKKLIDKGMVKKDLMKLASITSSPMAKMSKGHSTNVKNYPLYHYHQT